MIEFFAFLCFLIALILGVYGAFVSSVQFDDFDNNDIERLHVKEIWLLAWDYREQFYYSAAFVVMGAVLLVIS